METKTNILFTGVMSALVSCVDEDGNVYERSMRRLMNDQMKAGLNGFYLCGGTGAVSYTHLTLPTKLEV